MEGCSRHLFCMVQLCGKRKRGFEGEPGGANSHYLEPEVLPFTALFDPLRNKGSYISGECGFGYTTHLKDSNLETG